jgi:predicted homoserine dehydrogenase-like protein
MAEIKIVGVIGAGQMGSGIAHVCALNGYDVLLNDVSVDQIDKGLEAVRRGLERQVSKGQISEADMDAAVRRVTSAPDIAALAPADLVDQGVGGDGLLDLGRSQFALRRRFWGGRLLSFDRSGRDANSAQARRNLLNDVRNF